MPRLPQGWLLVAGEQGARRGANVRLTHQGFADEEGLDPRLGEAAAIGVPRNAALADRDTVLRDFRSKPLGDFKRCLKRAQVAIVDADKPRFQGKSAIELPFVMDLDQDIEAEVMRGLVESPRALVVDASHDDQDAIGAPGARFEHLVRVEQKVLAQHRQPRRIARLADIFGLALKGRSVGQNGKAGCAALLIGLGERMRVEMLADQALRGAGLLDLGDKSEAARRDLALDRLDEAARRALLANFALQRRARHADFRVGNFTPFVSLDLLQDVGHRGSGRRQAFETATNLASVACAAPESSALAASSRPWPRSRAFSATTRAPAALSKAMSR